MNIPIDDLAKSLAEQFGGENGFTVTIEPAGAFPKGCVTARIKGPGFPPNGLPFCIPQEGAETWAARLNMQFGIVYTIGMANTTLPADGADPAQAASPEAKKK